MAYQLFTLPKQLNISSSFTLSAGAKAYFFATTTTTPQDTYTDAALTITHAHPVVADAAGVLPPIYLDPTLQYKLTLNTAADALIYTVDPVNDQLLSQATIGQALYPQTPSELAAGVTPSNFFYPPGHIQRYGASTAGSAAANTIAVQQAIDANYGQFVYVPFGNFSIATTGSTTAPVGSALTITDTVTIELAGNLVATNHCNNFSIAAGAGDIVTIVGNGGGLQGFGTFFEVSNFNGALIRVESGLLRASNVRLVDPPQYAISAHTCPGGDVTDCEVIGGQTTYPGDNNYGICLMDGSSDWKVTGLRTTANAGGGKVSQAIASLTGMGGSGAADRTQVVGCHLVGQWEKGTYLIADDCQIIGTTVSGCTQGEGLRVIGKRSQLIGNTIRSCSGGGITAYDSEGCLIQSNVISDCDSLGILVGYASTSAGKSLNNARILDNTIIGKSSGSNLVEAIRVAGDSGTATVERRITVSGNHIDVADMGANDSGAIRFLPNNGATTFQDLRCEGNTVNGCGSYGIRFAAGVYTYARCIGNKVHDPGSSSSVAARSAFRWDASVTWVGNYISDNEARSEGGSSDMSYGFENVTSADIQSTAITNNHSRGHVTAGYLNMQHASNSRSGNRMGDNSLQGALLPGVAASFAIGNSNAQAGMQIDIYPKNASAVVLQTATNALYWDGTVTAGTSFTLKTGAGGNAAGTESYEYSIRV